MEWLYLALAAVVAVAALAFLIAVGPSLLGFPPGMSESDLNLARRLRRWPKFVELSSMRGMMYARFYGGPLDGVAMHLRVGLISMRLPSESGTYHAGGPCDPPEGMRDGGLACIAFDWRPDAPE